MPRLDNTNPEVLEVEEFKLKVEYNSPVDLCFDCYNYFGIDDDVDHPPYIDSVYNCAWCGNTLTEFDDIY